MELMEITDTKQAYFDKSVFPPLQAIKPSPDLLPHSALPDFCSIAALPFDDNEEGYLPAPALSLHEYQSMDKALPDPEDEVMAGRRMTSLSTTGSNPKVVPHADASFVVLDPVRLSDAKNKCSSSYTRCKYKNSWFQTWVSQ